MTTNRKSIFIVLFLMSSLVRFSWAASVTTTKNQKALIDLEGSDVSEGDEFYLLNSQSKKMAVIRIKQVKNNKALADILKGSASAGYTLLAKPNKTLDSKSTNLQKSDPHSDIERSSQYLYGLRDSYGIVGESLINTMSVAVKNTSVSPALTDTVALKGSSFGLGAFYDYIATDDIAIQLAGLYEQLNVSGTSSIPGCSAATSTSCSVNITYLSFYGTAKYYFSRGHYRIWGGLGGGFLLALAKSATALNESQISSNQIALAALGMDVQVSRKNYIPLALEYHYFPATDTVKASSITLKAGWAWNFK